MAISALHRRVVTVALDQLQREAFGEAAREDAGRLQGLQALEHFFDVSERSAKPLGDVLEGAGEIAGLVERVDQRARDHAVGGLFEHDHRLPGEVLAQGDRRGDIGLDVGRAVLAAAAARHPRPRGRREALAFVLRRALQRRRGAVGIEGVVDLGAEILRERRRIGFERIGGPVAGFDGVRGVFERGGLARDVHGGRVVGPLQQGIALQLAFDEGGELGAGHLQEFDRLQKLRRQDHRLALTHCEFMRKRHPRPPARSPFRNAARIRGLFFAYTTQRRSKDKALGPQSLSAMNRVNADSTPFSADLSRSCGARATRVAISEGGPGIDIKSCLYLYCAMPSGFDKAHRTATARGFPHMSTSAADYAVADLGLAAYGRKEIAIAETEMPGLMATRAEFGAASRSRARASPARCT